MRKQIGAAVIGLITLLAIGAGTSRAQAQEQCSATGVAGTHSIQLIENVPLIFTNEQSRTLSVMGMLAARGGCSIEISCVSPARPTKAEKQVANELCKAARNAVSRSIARSDRSEISLKKIAPGSGRQMGVVYVLIQ